MRDVLEKIWVKIRDEIDEIKERITLKEITPHIGKCFMDVEEDHTSGKVEATNYYKLIAANGYGATYIYVRIDDKGGITIEPKHYGGAYIVEHYAPLSNAKFKRALLKAVATLNAIIGKS